MIAATPESHRLPHSGIDVVLVTESVTLTREGQLIDGRGVLPDMRVDVDLRTITGPGNTMLERAVEVLQEKRERGVE